MPEDQTSSVTQLLRHWADGDAQALGQLLPLIYDELRRVAHYQLQRERPDHTLQSTALVNEAYLRLLGGQAPELRDRSHFVAIAAKLIRQILVDYARERRAAKRRQAASKSEDLDGCREAGMRICSRWTMLSPICIGSMSDRRKSST